MKNHLFDGIDKLTEVLGERYKAVDVCNDFLIKYVVKNSKPTVRYETFNRWVDLYWHRPYLRNKK